MKGVSVLYAALPFIAMSDLVHLSYFTWTKRLDIDIIKHYMSEGKMDVSPKRFMVLIVGSTMLVGLLLLPSLKQSDPLKEGKGAGDSMLQLASRQQTASKTTTLNVSVSLEEAQFYRLESMNRAFMRKYPAIKVTLSNMEPASNPSDAYSLWMELGQQGMNADILLLDNSWVKPFAVRGYLKPADRIISGEAQSDQLDRLVEPLKWNGYVWAVPNYANPYIVLWNESLLKEVELTEPPEDWQSFVAAAEKLIAAHEEAAAVNLSSGDLQQLIVWLESLQALPSNSLYTFDFNVKEQEQLEWLQAMESHLGRRELTDSSQLYNDLELDRTLAAIVTWDVYKRMDDSLKKQLLVDRESLSYPSMNGGSFAISSSAKNEEEAAIWIEEMTSSDYQQEAYERFGLLPARASLYSKSWHSDSELTPPLWAAEALSEKHDVAEVALDPGWPTVWNEMERQWSLLLETQPPDRQEESSELTAAEP